ncbi:MAG: DEAD/DEAH box helicase, partial [Candidatus Omnitrophota bacterium]
MMIEELKREINEEVVETWKAHGIEILTPIQELAVNRFKLFGPRNLLVLSPTSSGKTFIGEMAALKSVITLKKKVIYASPLKVLAEEKFRDFNEKYGQHGVDVVISTRDHKEYDGAIENGDFDIAVVVVEKLHQLLTKKIDILNGLGLLIVDEFSLITDLERGLTLEMALSKCIEYQKRLPGRFKIIGLSAVMGSEDLLKEWLSADILRDNQRPVELRRGLLKDGVFRFQMHNSRRRGEERFVDVPKAKAGPIIEANAVRFVENNETVLIFLKDKPATRDMAARLADKLTDVPEAGGAVEELKKSEQTATSKLLLKCLNHGVAFHNADMSYAERHIVEKYFLAGEIKAVISTGTLGMGVNLPIKNVLVEPRIWRSHTKPAIWYGVDGFKLPGLWNDWISPWDFENKGGRAGRISMGQDFGRAILVVENLRQELMFKDYLSPSPVEPICHFRGEHLGTTLLNLVTTEDRISGRRVIDFLKNTLSGRLMDEHAFSDQQLTEQLREELNWCKEFGFLTCKNKELYVTPTGKVCAENGISVQTGKMLLDWLRAVKNREISELEMLYCLMRTIDGQMYHYNMSTKEDRSYKYHPLIKKRLAKEAKEYFVEGFNDRRPVYETHKMMKGALALHDWILGMDMESIEREYKLFQGVISRMSEGARWLIDSVLEFAEFLNFDASKVEFIKSVSERLYYGVEAEGLPLARLGIDGMTREHINALVKAGFAGIEKIKDTDQAELA